MLEEADAAGVGIDIAEERNPDGYGPQSALLMINGDAANEFAARWTGSIFWACNSPFRRNHERKN